MNLKARIVVATFILLSACGGSNHGTPARIWGAAVLVETDNAGDANSPDIAVDAAGNVTVVWRQNDGTRNDIRSNRYVMGQGWVGPQPVEYGNDDARGPSVAVDPSGNAVAVWRQSDGARYSAYAARYGAGAWSWAAALEFDNTGDVYDVKIAFDAIGNALALWQQGSNNQDSIWSSYLVAGLAWTSPQPVENLGDHASEVEIAFDPSGNALAVWRQSDGAQDSVWANRFDAATLSWGAATTIESGNTGRIEQPAIATDAAGNAIAVWRQLDGVSMRFDTWTNRYVAGQGWGTEQMISDGSGDTATPSVALDAAGNAIVVWYQYAGARTDIWANRYVAGQGWGAAQLIEHSDTGSANIVSVAMDSSGNAIAVWRQTDGTLVNNAPRYDIWANRYVAGRGWGTPRLLETDNTGTADGPQLVMDSAGNATVAWGQSDGTRYNLWAVRYE